MDGGADPRIVAGETCSGWACSSLVYAAAVYHDAIEAVAFDLPNQIATAIGGGEFGANSFDDLSGRAWASGLRVWPVRLSGTVY